jgi:hypothetical protein
MSANVASVILNVLLALALLLLPGLALLRATVPTRLLDLVSRVAIAPGITTALTVLIFTWCEAIGIKSGPFLPWIFIIGSVLVLLFVRPEGARRRSFVIDLDRLRRIPISEWLASVALMGIVLIFFLVRFAAARGWCVPPGVDTAQHTTIVQLLIEHHGLFQSWAPYSDGETFTYHFGFHAIAALFAWLTGLDAVSAVFIMARVAGVAAVVSIFGLVRLWTRSSWGGVFAVAFWELYSDHLYAFDVGGRWTLLTGLMVLTSALALPSLYLRPRSVLKELALGLICGITVAGLALTQYKVAIIFAVLVASLFATRCIAVLFSDQKNRVRRILEISCRMSAIAALALLLASPRLNAIMHARTGRYLKHMVLETPAVSLNPLNKSKPTAFDILRSGFGSRRKALVSIVAMTGLVLIVTRRQRPLWFVLGWIGVSLVMNPNLIGSSHPGLIDSSDWELALEPAIASVAGLTAGYVCEFLLRTSSILGNILALIAALTLSLRGAIGLPPLGDWRQYVLPQDLRLFEWIRGNVPGHELIAGRAIQVEGEDIGCDAMLWLPYFTRHRTNHTTLAAALEKGSSELRYKMREFNRELYARDMSNPESAKWMREQGFPWFYAGATDPEQHRRLLEQLASNPGLEIAWAEGDTRLYHVK